MSDLILFLLTIWLMDAYLSLSFSFRNIFVRPQLLNCRPKYMTTSSIIRDTYIISFFNHVVLMLTFPRVYYIFSRGPGPKNIFRPRTSVHGFNLFKHFIHIFAYTIFASSFERFTSHLASDKNYLLVMYKLSR